MPPFSEVLDMWLRLILPVAGAAAVVFLVCTLVFSKFYGRFPGVILGLVAAFAMANYSSDNFPWYPEKKNWESLSWAILIMILCDLLICIRQIPAWLIGMISIGVVGTIISRTTTYTSPTLPNWTPIVVGVVTWLHWLLFSFIGKKYPGSLVTLLLSIQCFGVSMIIIHAHSAKMMDFCMIFGSVLFGLFAASQAMGLDIGRYTAGFAVLLPGLLLGTYESTSSEVPLSSFITAGLAPFSLFIALMPNFYKLPRKWNWLIPLILIIIPIAVSVGIAMQYESIVVE